MSRTKARCLMCCRLALRPSTSNAEECTVSILPVGSTLVADQNDEVIQISDTESDEQFQVELPDVQVVGDGVATTSVTSESLYLFNNPVVRGSVGAIAIGNDNVSTNDSVTSGSEPHYTFSNPVLQNSVGATVVGTNNIFPVTSGLEPHNQGSVDITTRGTDNLSTDICSGVAQYSSISDPVIQGSVTQTAATVPTSSFTSDPLLSVTTTEVAASHVANEDACEYNDIGALILPSKSTNEIISTMHKLTNSQKYSLLFNHVKPPRILPSTYAFGCNQKFKIEWLTKYAWLRYSPKLDGVFCGPFF